MAMYATNTVLPHGNALPLRRSHSDPLHAYRFDLFAEDVSDRILTTITPGMRAECKWIEDGKYYAGQCC